MGLLASATSYIENTSQDKLSTKKNVALSNEGLLHKTESIRQETYNIFEEKLQQETNAIVPTPSSTPLLKFVALQEMDGDPTTKDNRKKHLTLSKTFTNPPDMKLNTTTAWTEMFIHTLLHYVPAKSCAIYTNFDEYKKKQDFFLIGRTHKEAAGYMQMSNKEKISHNDYLLEYALNSNGIISRNELMNIIHKIKESSKTLIEKYQPLYVIPLIQQEKVYGFVFLDEVQLYGDTKEKTYTSETLDFIKEYVDIMGKALYHKKKKPIFLNLKENHETDNCYLPSKREVFEFISSLQAAEHKSAFFYKVNKFIKQQFELGIFAFILGDSLHKLYSLESSQGLSKNTLENFNNEEISPFIENLKTFEGIQKIKNFREHEGIRKFYSQKDWENLDFYYFIPILTQQKLHGIFVMHKSAKLLHSYHYALITQFIQCIAPQIAMFHLQDQQYAIHKRPFSIVQNYYQQLIAKKEKLWLGDLRILNLNALLETLSTSDCQEFMKRLENCIYQEFSHQDHVFQLSQSHFCFFIASTDNKDKIKRNAREIRKQIEALSLDFSNRKVYLRILMSIKECSKDDDMYSTLDLFS